jgi:hypothetical protein
MKNNSSQKLKKMKTIQLFIFSGILLISACKQNQTTVLTFTNPIDEPRINEVVEFTFDELEMLIGSFIPDKFPLFISGNDTLVAQFINYQGDSLPEEILIKITLEPKETREVAIQWIKKDDYPEFPVKTSLHFARHEDPSHDLENETRLQTTKTQETSSVFQMEGPAWENEKVGFRNYFDLRNGMDIFGKRTDKMVLMNVGLNEKTSTVGNLNFEESYHELNDWGMDVLKVGNSLGAGAIALEINDSLYKVGDNGYGTYEKLYEGPLRSEFRFSFPDWEANGEIHKITHYVSITAGEYAYKSTLFLQETGDNEYLVTGIVNKHSDSLIQVNAGQNHLAYFTHSQQAEDGSYLAMAIMTPKDQFIAQEATADDGLGITETYTVKMKTQTGNPSTYRFYALWERSDPHFSDPEIIKAILHSDALKMENPVIVSEK